MLVSNSDLVDQLQRKRLDFEENLNAKKILHKEKQGEIDSLVEQLSHSNRKLTDLRTSVRDACKRWESESRLQQQDVWKLQQAAVALQRSAVSKSIQSSPQHADIQPLSPHSFQTPNRSVFSEVQLNGQRVVRQEHDPKVDRQVLHTQLRSMITTSTGTLRTLSQLGHSAAEYQPHSPHYEQSGLFMMIDPETGKPIGGQLVQPEQICGVETQPPNAKNQPPQSLHETRHQPENQHNQPQCEAHEVDPSAGHSTLEPGNESPCSPQDCVEQQAIRCSVGPIELLTPAIDHAQQARCKHACSVDAIPDLGSAAEISNASSPGEHRASLRTEPHQHAVLADKDEHDLAQAEETSSITQQYSGQGFRMTETARSAESYAGKEEENDAPDEQGHDCIPDEGILQSRAEKELSSPRVEQEAKEADLGVQASSSHLAAEESHGNVHMQPSGTSLSSLEVPEPIVGPIGMGDLKFATREPSEQWEQEQSKETTGTSFVRDGEKFLSVTKNSLQFSDDAAGTQLGSSAVLELLKEESDLMEDDDGPMSFMTPRWSSRKSTRKDELSKSPEKSATKPAPVVDENDFDF